MTIFLILSGVAWLFLMGLGYKKYRQEKYALASDIFSGACALSLTVTFILIFS